MGSAVIPADCLRHVGPPWPRFGARCDGCGRSLAPIALAEDGAHVVMVCCPDALAIPWTNAREAAWRCLTVDAVTLSDWDELSPLEHARDILASGQYRSVKPADLEAAYEWACRWGAFRSDRREPGDSPIDRIIRARGTHGDVTVPGKRRRVYA